MIRRLRLRFVRIVMQAFLVVLVLTMLGVNIVNAVNVYRGIDDRLDYLADSSLGPPAGLVSSTPESIRSWVDLNSAGIMDETSYFKFLGGLDGPHFEHQLDMLSAETGQDASALIDSLLTGSRDRGNVSPYRYYIAERGETYMLVFLRCDAELSSIRSLWRTSLAVGLITLALVFVISAFLSGMAVRPFEENIENQRRFISNASHELKTPLGVIMSDLDLQIMESGSSEWLENAQLQADHLSLLIEQLTAYSLLSEKKNDAALPVDISALGEELLSAFRPLAVAGGQTLTAEIEPDVAVRGDADTLRTLLSVLVENAVKYTPAGGEIHLSVRREKRAVIEVTNTCDSLAEEDLSRLFERFYRGSEQRARQDGHGLGLAIAQEIASLYGGSVRAARSGNGRSVIFTVELD